MKLTIHFDGGGKNPGPSACAAVIYDLAGKRLCGWGETIGPATNNIAEYSGLLLGLRMADSLGATHVTIKGDSELIVNQVNGRWKVNDYQLRVLHRQAVSRLQGFEEWSLAWHPREENKDADALCREALGQPLKRKRNDWRKIAQELAASIRDFGAVMAGSTGQDDLDDALKRMDEAVTEYDEAIS